MDRRKSHVCIAREYRLKTHSSLKKQTKKAPTHLKLDFNSKKKAIPKLQTEHQSQFNHNNKMKQ